MPLDWEIAVFNGLVTGGAETGSSGELDDNFALPYAGMVHVMYRQIIHGWGITANTKNEIIRLPTEVE